MGFNMISSRSILWRFEIATSGGTIWVVLIASQNRLFLTQGNKNLKKEHIGEKFECSNARNNYFMTSGRAYRINSSFNFHIKLLLSTEKIAKRPGVLFEPDIRR